ncbi:HAD family phosphatase [Flavobacterium sp. NRK F10]|uniref:HAD family hydrolase n=1 Tax=Flavobacterium sp. NRK F10 TaxID=2954931 RepID=UPI0020902463|nr:HAD family phosphatase [Flavobacterium sp. NRK F10]MCO6174030.1 HAD family phosphatase [Flavobacterium sp. NRK F10]
MINTILFDFGDVFINLDKNATPNALKKLGLLQWNPALNELNQLYETGKIDEGTFLEGIKQFVPKAQIHEIKEAWNAILQDFPLDRLEFLQMLSDYRLLLLSNTDATHIEHFEHKVGESFARDFYSCFEKTYFSFDIGMRKPDKETFRLVINNHNLTPKRTLFIDDKKENIESAKKLGFKTWHLNPTSEDVTQLFEHLKKTHA